MHRQHLTEADQQNIVSYIEIRDQNSCRECLVGPASCCGCPEHEIWNKHFKAAEELISDIEPQARLLWEKWTACNNRIDNLSKELEQERKERQQIFAQLQYYLKNTAAGFSAVAVKEHTDTV